jgi:hypothetical protein
LQQGLDGSVAARGRLAQLRQRDAPGGRRLVLISIDHGFEKKNGPPLRTTGQHATNRFSSV